MIQLETPYDEGPSTNYDQYQHSQSSPDKIPQMISSSQVSKRCNTLLETPSPTTDRKYYNSKPIITKVQRHDTSSNRSGIPILIKRGSDDTSFSKMKDLESSDRWREDNSSNLFCCWYDYIDELIYDTFSTCTPIAVCIDDGCGAFTTIWTEE